MSLIGLVRPVPICQRGLSLVELMVGITIGLFIVAAAVTLTSNQLVDNRRLLLELQIQQDLRATMDIMTRQLRRAGSNTVFAQGRVADNGLGGIKPTEPDAEVTTAGAGPNQAEFRFYRNAAEQGPFGFRLDEANGVIVTQIGPGNPQELTDRSAMRVTALTFNSQPLVSGRLPCPKLCPGPDRTGCWPELVIQRLTITITAEARSNPNIRRSLSSDVRVRNDWLRDNAAAAVTQVCPV